MRIASADMLPFDYEEYGKEIGVYLQNAGKKAKESFGTQAPSFTDALKAASRMEKAGAEMLRVQSSMKGDPGKVNQAMMETERAFLTEGLPNRPWFKHAIYAPGEYTGYAAVVVPGVNEAIDKKDVATAEQQLKVVTDAINRAAAVLEQGK